MVFHLVATKLFTFPSCFSRYYNYSRYYILRRRRVLVGTIFIGGTIFYVTVVF